MKFPNLFTVLFLCLLGGQEIIAQNSSLCIAATISVREGDTTITCAPGAPDWIRFQTSRVNTPFGYLVTQPDGEILRVSQSDKVSFAELPGGQLRVYAFSYLGNILAEAGENVFSDSLASVCAQLSANFINVNNVVPEGGIPTTVDGLATQHICTDDDVPDVLSFTTNVVEPAYTFLLTDENDQLLQSSAAGVFDFTQAPAGTCRVWGLSYTGDLLVQAGDKVTMTELAEGCFDLSDTFASVIRTLPEGGTIGLSGGEASFSRCDTDASEDVSLSLSTDNEQTFAYSYILTDADGVVIRVLSENELSFQSLPAGVSQVRGVSYAGELQLEAGQLLTETNVATGCFDLSDNSISLERIYVDGGQVSLDNGQNQAEACGTDETSDHFSFQTDSQADLAEYAWILTGNNNFIKGVFTELPINLDPFQDETDFRVYGLSYQGELLSVTGQSIAEAVPVAGCYDISQNFSSITILRPDGANVSLADGTTSFSSCDAPDAEAVTLNFVTTNDQDFDYAYLLIDAQNRVIQVVEGDQILFSELPEGTSRVQGVSYSGTLTAQPGQDLDRIDPVDGCYTLSENVITLERIFVDGGEVSLPSPRRFCGVDDMPDLVSPQTTSTAEQADFAWVVTNTQNTVVGVFTQLPIDLADLPEMNRYRFWGLSYQGQLISIVGQPFFQSNPVDGCFDISDNFMAVRVLRPDGGTISLSDGTTEITGCDLPSNENETLTLSTTNQQNFAYTYVLLDGQNNILQVIEDNTITLAELPLGPSFIRGISYDGALTAQAGDNLLAMDPVDGCYDLSDNILSLERVVVNGGTVSLPDGSTEARPCGLDNISDTFSFVATGEADEAYAWVLTGDNGFIKGIFTELPISLDNFNDEDNFRVYGLSYRGTILSVIGQELKDAILVDGCYDISDNFVTLTRIRPAGGTISLADGATFFTGCSSPDAAPTLLQFANDQDDSFAYAYLMLDQQGTILRVYTDDMADLADFPPVVSFVQGVSYEGTLTAEPGQNLTEIDPVDGCFALSDNMIEIDRVFVDGADVTILNGGTFALVCGNDDIPDALIFNSNTTATDKAYSLIVTDENNRIFSAANGGVIDFDLFAAGSYRVWGVSYTGMLSAPFGADITAIPLSNGCFDLSNNFVTIRQEEVNGGQVLLAQGGTTVFTCPGDGMPDVIQYVNNGFSSDQYVYLITDDENRILATTVENNFDVETAGLGNCRIYGLAYSGALNAPVGVDLTTIDLSDECYSLSDNFITVVRAVPDGGTVALDDGGEVALTCPGDGIADLIRFSATTDYPGPYIFVITDEQDNILDISTTGRYDFDFAPPGNCHVYGLAYTGTADIPEGELIHDAILSDDCFDVSDNFLTIIREVPDAGRVSLRQGGRRHYTCPNDGQADVVEFRNNSQYPGNYWYVITDANNQILTSTTAASLDFENATEGICRVWGLAFTGTATITPGENITTAILSDDCYDISTNFISVIRETPDGGTITTPQGDTLTLCVGDALPDLVTFEIMDASNSRYAYLITDADGILLKISEEPSADFNESGPGNCRIYGVAYTGELTIQPGEDVTTTPLSDDCYDLTDNFVYLDRLNVDGSIIATGSGATDVEYICSGDGVDDIIQFTTQADTEDADYRFLLTDDDNRIIGPVNNAMINVEGTPFDRLRVWGVAFTGEFDLSIGQDITATILSDSCYDVSNNFISLISGMPEGGMVTTANGRDTVRVCIGGADGILDVKTTSSSQVGYVYLITTQDSLLLAMSPDSTIDFNEFEAGNYLVWGLSYTGQLNITEGELITTSQLASSCFELAEKPIFVTRSEPIDGGTIMSAFGDPLFVCLNDNQPDLGAFTTTSTSPNYRYVITDTLNNIVIPDVIGNVIDFDKADAGVSRVYGVSFTGNFTAAFGDNVLEDQLSDICSATSSNFVTLIKSELIGGMVSTETGATEVTIIAGDGMADVIAFDSTGTTDDQYAYLITDESNTILGVMTGDRQDFEGAGVGNCRVWGVAYTGTLLAQQDETLDMAILSDRCYRLSENFVTVERVAPGEGRPTFDPPVAAQRTLEMAVHLYPNPAGDLIQLQFTLPDLDESDRKVRIEIFGAAGQRYLASERVLDRGAQQLELDISDLSPGVYLLTLTDGQQRAQVRFVKQ